MATLTINTTTAQDQRIAPAFKSVFNYQEQIPDPNWDGENPPEPPMIPNPEGVAAFVRRHVITFMRNVVKQYEANEAANAARQAAIAQVDADLDME